MYYVYCLKNPHLPILHYFYFKLKIIFLGKKFKKEVGWDGLACLFVNLHVFVNRKSVLQIMGGM